ncbi:MAG TPA: glycosyltransferase family 4 protein [Clostridia bacterium]|nr:glycosyltransferase family 4 protein [Clostridia bacterium]
MRIAIVAPPFIPVPPVRYGGTELFVARLAEGLKQLGIDVLVYANGESTVDVEVRWLYGKSDWPIRGEVYANLKDIDHTAWAIHDAWHDADIIHLNNVPGLAFSRFSGPPFVYTVHHPHEPKLSYFYKHYPDVHYVTISRFQQKQESMPHMRTIHHGLDMTQYQFCPDKQDYICFLGRIAPNKGTDLAIEAALRTGIPLKIAGEIQPVFQQYFDTKVKPYIDGRFIEYVGEADLAAKNELLGKSKALLFPIQWDEPFGLVMTEAMATGTPVVALPGGSVPEIVKDGVSGLLCSTVDDMVARIGELDKIKPAQVRAWCEKNFSMERMARDYAELYANILEDQLTAMPEPEEPRALA